MDKLISTLKLYHMILERSDKKTAEDAMSAFEETVKEQVKTEMKDPINDLRKDLIDRMNAMNVDLIDRINTAKMQTWGLIIGVGVLQLVAFYLLK